MTIPNLITVLRLVLVPVVVTMIGQGRWGLAFLLFAIAGLSDAVDGFIARRFDMRSELGAYIDPLADKALLVSIYVALSVVGVIPGWVAIAVVSRDLAIVAAVIVSRLMDRPMRIKPLLVSKVNTAVQIAVAGGVLAMLAFGLHADGLVEVAMAIVVGLTVLSAAAYLPLWLRHMAGP